MSGRVRKPSTVTAPIIVVVAPVRIGPQKLAMSSARRAVAGCKKPGCNARAAQNHA